MSAEASEVLAEKLLQIKAIKLNTQNPFQWASGIISPIYCDNRIALSYPETRNLIKDGLTRICRDEYAESNCIAGVATAGIPHGTLVADNLSLPFVYVRSSAKSHGRKNAIEGQLPQNARVVVVEDLISTGMSSLEAVEKIKAGNAEVLGVIAIFTYALEDSFKAFAEAECGYKTLLDYPTLLKIAQKLNYINPADLVELELWRQSPHSWRK